jgi:hypothetical protein
VVGWVIAGVSHRDFGNGDPRGLLVDDGLVPGEA